MKNKFNRLIYFDEYRNINGIDQYLFHAGTSYDNPVILFLHGGPGTAESTFAYTFQKKWEDIFTVVHLDQRGAGKTLTKNPDKKPTVELLLQDVHETIAYLKKKYNKDKIIILGHSWGTILGTLYIRKYPEDVAYYIGTGQVISMYEGEHTGFEKTKELAAKNNDIKSLKYLENFSNYPDIKNVNQFMKDCTKVRKIEKKYNLAPNPLTFSMLMKFFKSPIFELSDISAMIKSDKANEYILEFLLNYDIRSESSDFKVPIYYVLGEDDWQVPSTVAIKYLEEVKAPNKKLYLIPHSGHLTMYEQPDLYFDALADINKIEKSKVVKN